ncbi:MAG: hypothetical protein ABIH42_08525 [Planctomycetota bacterium]
MRIALICFICIFLSLSCAGEQRSIIAIQREQFHDAPKYVNNMLKEALDCLHQADEYHKQGIAERKPLEQLKILRYAAYEYEDALAILVRIRKYVKDEVDIERVEFLIKVSETELCNVCNSMPVLTD